MTAFAINPFKLLPILLVSALLVSCGLFEPEEKSYASPRDLTWELTVISNPGASQTFLIDIWGSSPDNVYITGHSSSGQGELWHFDGESWRSIPFHEMEGGLIHGGIGMNDIWGSSADDIWAVGDVFPGPTGMIVHYDGEKWSTELELDQPLHGIWGRKSNDIYAVGESGVVKHYNGSGWEHIQLPDSLSLQNVGGDRDDVFIYGGYWPFANRQHFMFQLSGTDWHIQGHQTDYDFRHNPQFGQTIYSPKRGHIYSSNQFLFKWNGDNWDKIDTREYWMIVGGAAPDNLIIAGSNGYGMHWNGEDWADLDLPADFSVMDIWVDKGEVFLTGYGAGGTTYVYHGK
ncbi:hypothetical protein ACFL6E_01120 [Candidatus Neomarinimicrobiota bacterium]